jgi:hypothetical protein
MKAVGKFKVQNPKSNVQGRVLCPTRSGWLAGEARRHCGKREPGDLAAKSRNQTRKTIRGILIANGRGWTRMKTPVDKKMATKMHKMRKNKGFGPALDNGFASSCGGPVPKVFLGCANGLCNIARMTKISPPQRTRVVDDDFPAMAKTCEEGRKKTPEPGL